MTATKLTPHSTNTTNEATAETSCDSEQATNNTVAMVSKDRFNRGLLESKDFDQLVKVVKTMQPRSHTLVDMAEQARFYFEGPGSYEEKSAQKFLTAKIKPVLETISTRLAGLAVWTEEAVNLIFKEIQQETGLKMKEVAQAVRLALTGRTASPGLFEIMEILGPEEVQRRLKAAMAVCS